MNKLTVISGPMFSGKTRELLRRIDRARIGCRAVQVFTPAIDTRDEFVRSHSGERMESHSATSALEIVASDICDVIAIDEAQFFSPALVDACLLLIDKGKDVIVAGLNLDSRGRGFGPMPELLAQAHEIVKLSAVCIKCGDDAHYTQRLMDESELVAIGGAKEYEARCRVCWVAR